MRSVSRSSLQVLACSKSAIAVARSSGLRSLRAPSTLMHKVTLGLPFTSRSARVASSTPSKQLSWSVHGASRSQQATASRSTAGRLAPRNAASLPYRSQWPSWVWTRHCLPGRHRSHEFRGSPHGRSAGEIPWIQHVVDECCSQFLIAEWTNLLFTRVEP